MPPHLLRCQGIAVDNYSFTLGRLEAGAPLTFAQLGYKRIECIQDSPVPSDLSCSSIELDTVLHLLSPLLCYIYLLLLRHKAFKKYSVKGKIFIFAQRP